MGHLLASASGVDLWAGPRSTLEDTRRAANSVHLKTILQEIRATGVDHPRVLVVERSPFTPEPLAAFVGLTGIHAGPIFLSALREAGLGLLLGGMVVTLAPKSSAWLSAI